jgi:tetratricopeptide (TPR) repeat protein
MPTPAAVREAEAAFNRGNTLYEEKEYDHAIREYNDAIRLDPGNALAYNNRGVTYY